MNTLNIICGVFSPDQLASDHCVPRGHTTHVIFIKVRHDHGIGITVHIVKISTVRVSQKKRHIYLENQYISKI